MELLGSIPTTWDETKIIRSESWRLYHYCKKKRRGLVYSGNDRLDPTGYSTLQLDFLDNGIYKAELCTDGVNAETYPSDYVMKNIELKKDQSLSIKMAPGGGFLLKLVKN